MSITIAIIAVTCLISIVAFSRPEMIARLVFWPYETKRKNEWSRFITSGFIHGGFLHLFVNMFVLYSFGTFAEEQYARYFGISGRLIYLAVYLLAIIVAELPSYLKHKDNPAYRSLGASGAVAAVLFASILFNPTGSVMLFLIPIPINSVIFGVLYVAYSYYMDKKQMDNVGHSAHLFGALFGFAVTIALKPSLFVDFVNSIQSMLSI